eukprot:CAMPEP_0117420334 /NCGR_PEP_ID=MMETSP0758-20121206/1685_1 /TAXON_ID=63605 /ORGANISM="Percolomonas cosmopolitus, Strain AE-1 (ATCC 50343)" /LENGTH=451 /DNA_ID=CAMNT_0005201873 /DNA_START=639 /DNA_END=1991 /DNA_ORIENTATION=-
MIKIHQFYQSWIEFESYESTSSFDDMCSIFSDLNDFHSPTLEWLSTLIIDAAIKHPTSKSLSLAEYHFNHPSIKHTVRFQSKIQLQKAQISILKGSSLDRTIVEHFYSSITAAKDANYIHQWGETVLSFVEYEQSMNRNLIHRRNLMKEWVESFEQLVVDKNRSIMENSAMYINISEKYKDMVDVPVSKFQIDDHLVRVNDVIMEHRETLCKDSINGKLHLKIIEHEQASVQQMTSIGDSWPMLSFTEFCKQQGIVIQEDSPLVIVSLSGTWDKVSQIICKHLEKILPIVKALHGNIIALTPDTHAYISKFKAKNKLHFHILQDTKAEFINHRIKASVPVSNKLIRHQLLSTPPISIEEHHGFEPKYIVSPSKKKSFVLPPKDGHSTLHIPLNMMWVVNGQTGLIVSCNNPSHRLDQVLENDSIIHSLKGLHALARSSALKDGKINTKVLR